MIEERPLFLLVNEYTSSFYTTLWAQWHWEIVQRSIIYIPTSQLIWCFKIQFHFHPSLGEGYGAREQQNISSVHVWGLPDKLFKNNTGWGMECVRVCMCVCVCGGVGFYDCKVLEGAQHFEGVNCILSRINSSQWTTIGNNILGASRLGYYYQ